MNRADVAWMVRSYQFPWELDEAHANDYVPSTPPPPRKPRMRLVFFTGQNSYTVHATPDMRISDVIQALHAFRLVMEPYWIMRFAHKGRIICFDDPRRVGELGLDDGAILYLVR